MRPTLLNLETNEELRADAVLDEVNLRRSLEWRHVASAAPSGFVRTAPQQITITLAFDSDRPGREVKDVRPRMAALERMTAPGERGHPPRILFTWGALSLPAIIDTAAIQYSRCVPQGFPTRAAVALRLTEAKAEKPAAPTGAGLSLQAPLKGLTALVAGSAGLVLGAAAAVGAMRERAERAVTELRERANKVKEAVETEIKNAELAVQKQVSEVKDRVEEAKSSVEKTVQKTKGEVEEAINQEKNEIEKAVNSAKESLLDEAKKWESIPKEWLTKLDQATKPIQELSNTLQAAAAEATVSLAAAGVAAANQVTVRIAAEAAELKQRAENLLSEVAATASGAVTSLRDGGTAAIEELERRVKSEMESARSACDELRGGLDPAAKEAAQCLERFATELESLRLQVDAAAKRWKEWVVLLQKKEDEKQGAGFDADFEQFVGRLNKAKSELPDSQVFADHGSLNRLPAYPLEKAETADNLANSAWEGDVTTSELSSPLRDLQSASVARASQAIHGVEGRLACVRGRGEALSNFTRRLSGLR
jgi:uncharacterized protein YjbJ (UPF0337 family)